MEKHRKNVRATEVFDETDRDGDGITIESLEAFSMIFIFIVCKWEMFSLTMINTFNLNISTHNLLFTI